MKTVSKSIEILYTIEGSRFLAQLHAVSSKEEADDIIRSIRKAHMKSTHVVSALRLDAEGYYDDDGEPAQTAGAPLLSLLEGEDIVFTLITCVRYFGGTKLGKGGLIRAYSESGREAIRQASFQPLFQVRSFILTFSYPDQNAVDHLLNMRNAFRGAIEYTQEIKAKVYLRETEGFHSQYLDATQGRGLIEPGEQVYIYQIGEQTFERGDYERKD